MSDHTEHLNRLFKSASTEAPSAAAKARAIATMARVTSAPAVPATRVGLKGLLGPLSAVLCGIAAVALVSHRIARVQGVESVTPPSDVVASSPGGATGHGQSRAAPGPLPLPTDPRAAAARVVDQCSSIALPDEPPAVCSTDGAPLLLTIVNTCSTEPVDLYWVTFFCEERFFKQIAPGESVFQATYDTHPWRVRDHETHRLLKEIAPTGTAGTPFGPVVQAEELNRHVVVTPLDHAEETRPRCSEGGGHPEVLEVVNARGDEATDLYFVDGECTEVFFTRLQPGEDLRRPSYSNQAWRLRDHATQRLLKDLAPAAPSTGAAAPESKKPVAASTKSRREFVVSDRDHDVESENRCSEAGESIELSLVNDRSDAVELYWLDYDCEEVSKAKVEPGQRWTHAASDAYRWRVRDARTQALVKEFAANPDPLGQRLLVTVP